MKIRMLSDDERTTMKTLDGLIRTINGEIKVLAADGDIYGCEVRHHIIGEIRDVMEALYGER